MQCSDLERRPLAWQSGESNISTAIAAGSQITTLNNAALSKIWKSQIKKIWEAPTILQETTKQKVHMG